MLEEKQSLLSNNTLKTAALVVGAAIVAPAVFSLLKPLAKASIKTGVIVYQKTKEALAETGEQLGDLVAEAKAELQAEQSGAPVLEVSQPEE